MNFKDYFINLTKFTVPYGTEKDLEPLLPEGWKNDQFGNYFYEIGNSETLFTTHLDTHSEKKEKVNHIIDGDIIKTDGSTILGGDNKAGCVILIYMINNNIPGTYYFFLGEETAVHGDYPFGSINAIESGDFSKYKRCISFDRKESGQLITRQLGRNCCSDEFSSELIKEFEKSGVNYEKDKTGYYTDSAFFIDTIPEIVNLSCGVWNEHTKDEWVDISYVEKVARASCKVQWEKLPTKRIVDKKFEIDKRFVEDETKNELDRDIFVKIFTLMDDLYYVCHEIRSYTSYKKQFRSGRKYNFSKWHEDENIAISVSDGKINCNNEILNTFEDFQKWIGQESLPVDKFCSILLNEFEKNGNKITDAKINYLLTLKSNTIEDTREYLESIGYRLNQIGKGWELKKSEKNRYIKEFTSFRKTN